MPQKRAILQVRIEQDDKEHAERLFEAMGTSLSEAVRLFIKQSIAMRKLPFQPSAIRAADGQAAYGMLRGYSKPNLRNTERSAWISYLSMLREDQVRNPGEDVEP